MSLCNLQDIRCYASYVLRNCGRKVVITFLKNQIHVRTFADWNEKRVGLMDFDLVSYDGGNARGDYIQTLDGTDIPFVRLKQGYAF